MMNVIIDHGLMLTSAVFTIVYGCVRSHLNTTHHRGGKLDDENEEFTITNIPLHAIQHMDMKTACLFPVIASVGLLLMFYFIQSVYYILFGAVMLYAIFGISYSIYPLVNRIVSSDSRSTWNACTVLCVLFAVCTVIGYITTDWWILNNLIGFGLVVTYISLIKLPTIRIGLVLLAGLFIYDIFWVFYSSKVPIFKGHNVMVHVAKTVDLPVKYMIPSSSSSIGFSMLGLGDLVLPGILMSFMFEVDVYKKTMYSLKQGYFIPIVVGYTSGLIITFICLHLFQAAQPALLYLVPCTILPVLVIAYLRGEFKLLWNGVSIHKKHDVILPLAD
jgi:hypothetical protein